MSADEGFGTFVAQRLRDLQRISRATRAEHSLSDVTNEAWLMASTLSARKGIAIDFLCRSFQDLLISHLYQHLVRYTEGKVRHGIRLDHAEPGGEDDTSHWLMRTLVSDDGDHPLALLERMEASCATEAEPETSLAGAYVVLLRHFRNNMRAVASYLLISRSYAYRRCAYARLLATCQQAMPQPGSASTDLPFPRPWRKTRLFRVPVQFELPLDDELPLSHWVTPATTGLDKETRYVAASAFGASPTVQPPPSS